MLSHAYNIITDCGVGTPGYWREVVDGLNDTDKQCISMLTTTVKIPGEADYYSHLENAYLDF